MRRQTISEHAALNQHTYGWYIAGHLVAATSFYLFSRLFFAPMPNGAVFMGIVTMSVLADLVQALIPARDNLEIHHTVLAYVMAFAILATCGLAAFTVPQQHAYALASQMLFVVLVICLFMSNILDRRYFWQVQMASIALVYVQMYVVFFGYLLR